MLKVTFPHMGYLHIPFRSILNDLGLSVVVPPPITQETISLGTRYSPECACLPLKVNIGNFVQAAELGANTIVMAGGIGPCRFGYYAQVQKEILADLGIGFDMIVLEPPQGNLGELVKGIRMLTGAIGPKQIIKAILLGWAKLRVLDRLSKNLAYVRAREKRRGSGTMAWQTIIGLVDNASCRKELEVVAGQAQRLLDDIPVWPDLDVLKIGLIGEIYTVLEPAVNLEIERTLGEMGVHVVRSIFLSDWVLTNIVLNAIGLRNDKDHYRLAAPYLDSFVGGHGLESISNTISYARSGIDGIIHLAPLTCMPEIVAMSILPKVSIDEDIPVITLVMDEHSAETGIQTRLEAFCDLLKSRRSNEKQGRACGRSGILKGECIV